MVQQRRCCCWEMHPEVGSGRAEHETFPDNESVGRQDTCDQAHSQFDKRVNSHIVEHRLRLGTGRIGLPGLHARAVEAMDDSQLGHVAEEALCQVIILHRRGFQLLGAPHTGLKLAC